VSIPVRIDADMSEGLLDATYESQQISALAMLKARQVSYTLTLVLI
jgi:hypothetical protein